MAIAGLDIGSTGSKCTVFHDDGSISAYRYEEYPMERDRYGIMTINPERVWQAVQRVIAGAVADHHGDAVRALCITSFGEAGVPIDRDGNVLFNSMLYTDTRGVDQCNALVEKLGREEIMARSGHNAHPMYSAVKLMWLRDMEPDIFRRIWKFLLYADFVLYRLSGEIVEDWSMASRTLAFNVITKEWDPVLLEAAGLSADLFPRPVQGGTAVATVSPSAAKLTGLTPETLLLIGGQDQIGATVGAGVLEPGIAMNGIGSVDCICPVFDRPQTGEAMRRANMACVPYIYPDKYVTYAFSFFGGAMLKWYRDQLGQHARAEAERLGRSVYAYLDSIVPPEPTGILVLPHMSGAATPYMDVEARSAIIGLKADSGHAELYRALMEGVVYEMRINLECLLKAGVPVNRLVASGGGSRSSLWLQMRADVFNIPVDVLAVEEAGTLGAAVMAGAACGLFKSIEDGVRQLVRIRGTYQPDPARHARYMEIFEKYKRLYNAVRYVEGREMAESLV